MSTLAENFCFVAMLAGGLSLVFFVMAALADYALPYFARKPWRVNRRRSAAIRRAKP